MRKNKLLLILTAIILILMSVILIIAGGWLISLGGSWYYLLCGIAILFTALLLLKRSASALTLFAFVLAISTIWALWEVGLNWWQLVPRLWVWFIVGILLLLPWWRKPLINGSVSLAPKLLSTSVIITFIAGFASLFTSPGVITGQIVPKELVTVNPQQAAGDNWTAYGGTNAGLHYSKLNQITADNIGNLQEVWRIQTGDLPTDNDPVELTNENTPLKVNDRLYTCTAHGWVLALEPETGKTLWKYNPAISNEGAGTFKGWAHMTCRGLSYYDAQHYLQQSTYSAIAKKVSTSECPRRIYLPTADARLIALNADNGELCDSFGEHGQVDLRQGIGPFTPGGYYSTSPGLVTENLIIVGGHVTDDESTNEPSGVVRAFDIYDGHLVWNWDSGDPDATDPLPAGKVYTRNSPNVWSITSADEQLGLAYLPLGNQTPDQYGADRTVAAEKYSAGLVALDIATGKVAWNYQFIHHDLWDMDVPAQPILVDLKTDKGILPAVIQPTKQGSLYVLNRKTGEPIVPIDEIPAPQGAIAGDWTAKTQARSQLNLLPPPLQEKDMWGATLFDQLSCRIQFKSLRYDGQYTPPSLQGSLIYPGNVGVMNWGGVAIDPARQLIFASPNYMAFVSKLIPQNEVVSNAQKASEGAGLQPNKGAPYAVILKPFLSLVGFPCQAPSWGDVAGINLSDDKVTWKHPNGTSRDSTPIIPLPFPVGVPAMGGPMTTASGIAFLSGTLDQYLRGYDATNGKEIWSARLPAGGQATPMTFMGKDGRQYVVLVVGGHGSFGSKMGDYIIAYALVDHNK
ncbi:glucose/quinate/shikimate family membrane-bound PQQ-dependent dehydrogenase [Orbus sturtevantii]|uniref:glucose/quinate/shikimate family membrane-bound PQQ-dependent dehydrogenase n=1 Tax=Orbus sturtevantii TaxID=3074109 RepID=UPI00370DC55E